LVFVLGICIPGFAQVDLDHDLQFWNENTIIVPMVKQTKNGKMADLINLLIQQNNRIGSESFHPVDERIGVGFDVIVNKHFTFTPSYLYRASRTLPTVWDYEHRIRLDATTGYSWQHFGIKNRNRIERRIRNSRSNITRYRNRTALRVPITRNDKQLFDVFGTIEPFYDVTAKHWTYYEVTSGISAHIFGPLSMDFFYLHRGEIRSPQLTVNGFGVNAKIRIGK
jgi:hypothetical protein